MSRFDIFKYLLIIDRKRFEKYNEKQKKNK